jgi:hypothetical protein
VKTNYKKFYELSRIAIWKVDNAKTELELTYSAEYGAEIKASLTYRTIGGTWIKTIRYYNRAECLMDFATLTNDKKLIRIIERTEQYQSYLENS